MHPRRGRIAPTLALCAWSVLIHIGFSSPAQGQGSTQPLPLLPENETFGLYTDAPSYAPGEWINVFGSFPAPGGGPGKSTIYRVVRLTNKPFWNGFRFNLQKWPEVARSTNVIPPSGAPELAFGSYVEIPGLDARRFVVNATSEVTLGGWIFPTYIPSPGDVGADVVCIAGQMQLVDGEPQGPLALGIDETGHLFGLITLADASGTITRFRVTDPNVLPDETANGPDPLDRWQYVALVYDGVELSLCRSGRLPGDTVAKVASKRTILGRIEGADLPFRLGGRAEAPGDQTGCFDGYIDGWCLWSRPLSLAELDLEQDRGTELGGLGAPRNDLELDLEFEESYDDYADGVVLDSSGNGRHGSVFNYGTPGMGGRPETGQSLRLNHDLLLDARFPKVASFQVPSTATGGTPWPSGLYAVQAVSFQDDGSGQPAPDTEFNQENQERNHWAAFVVRPEPTQKAQIAVIVPTNTWAAYNVWPSREPDPIEVTARGLTQRTKDGIYQPQGSNGTYEHKGDGESRGHFISWQRVNLQASPVPRFDDSAMLPSGEAFPQVGYEFASLEVCMFDWLEAARSGALSTRFNGGSGITFDAYCDADLALGRVTLTGYDAVLLMGQPEYYSAEMLRQLLAYMDGTATSPGGNLLCVAGNAIGQRCEVGSIRTTSSGVQASSRNILVETRKWPNIKPMLGLRDGYSFIAQDPSFPQLGLWRLVAATADYNGRFTPPSWFYPPAWIGGGTIEAADYILGTRTHLSGMGESITFESLDDYGTFQIPPAAYTHWLWGGSDPTGNNGLLSSLGKIVGKKADGFLDPNDPLFAPPSPPGNIPQLPFVAPGGEFTILASGTRFSRGSLVIPPRMDPVQPRGPDRRSWAYLVDPECGLDPESLTPLQRPTGTNCDPCLRVIPPVPNLPPTTTWIQCNGISVPAPSSEGRGQIIYYEHRGGGKVLTIGSVQASRGLRPSRQGYSVLSDLLIRALDCFVYGNCP